MSLSATLSINPDRSQFFRYETVTLSCAVPGSFSGWALKRNTSSKVFDLCQTGWGRLNGSSCVISGAFMSDSGTYWCESERGECSDAVTSVVILEAPALPVTVGEQIMLRCSYKERYNGKSTSDFTASFFRNDVFIGARSKGRMTILAVAESDEGRYKCEHPTKGASPPSLLSVRAQSTAVPTTPFVMSLPKMVTTVLLFVLYTAIMVLCVVIYRRRARGKTPTAFSLV
uniref:Ig-like domain-containing protein n=1 Tax=Echeneis naucrates TaxID=173247 RepID=A0A665TGM8_ECHNA